MNSLAKTLLTQNLPVFSIPTVYNFIYEIKRFLDKAGTYTMLQVLYLQIPDLNMKEIIKSTALKNTEYCQNLI